MIVYVPPILIALAACIDFLPALSTHRISYTLFVERTNKQLLIMNFSVKTVPGSAPLQTHVFHGDWLRTVAEASLHREGGPAHIVGERAMCQVNKHTVSIN